MYSIVNDVRTDEALPNGCSSAWTFVWARVAAPHNNKTYSQYVHIVIILVSAVIPMGRMGERIKPLAVYENIIHLYAYSTIVVATTIRDYVRKHAENCTDLWTYQCIIYFVWPHAVASLRPLEYDKINDEFHHDENLLEVFIYNK